MYNLVGLPLEATRETLKYRNTDTPRFPKGPVRVVIQYTYGQLHIIWTEGSPVEIRSPARSNLIGRSMTAHLSVFLPSSILPPCYSLCAFIPSRKNPARVWKKIIISIYYFLKLRNLNLRKSERGCNRSLARLRN